MSESPSKKKNKIKKETISHNDTLSSEEFSDTPRKKLKKDKKIKDQEFEASSTNVNKKDKKTDDSTSKIRKESIKEEISVKEEINESSSPRIKEWTVEEKRQLYEKVGKFIPENDQKAYTKRINLINWNEINVSGCTGEELKTHFKSLVKTAKTKFYPLKDRLEICKKYIVENKYDHYGVVVNPYQLFTKEYALQCKLTNTKYSSRDVGQKWKSLSKDEKEIYALKLYREKIKKPFHLFYFDELKQKGKSLKETADIYVSLKDEEKLKWIKKSVDISIDEDTTHLTSDEKRILEGKPKKPLNAFLLFFKDYILENPGAERIAAKLAFHKLPKEKTAPYFEKAKKDNLIYNLEMCDYLLSLPEEQREADSNKSYLNSISKRKSTTKESKANKSIETDEKSKELPKASKEKRKRNDKEDVSKKKIKIDEDKDPDKKITIDTDDDDDKDDVTNNKIKIEKPMEPPASHFDYFCQTLFNGNVKKATKAFKNITSADRKDTKKAYKKLCKEYETKLETYLDSLSQEEIHKYHQSLANANSDDESS